MLPKSPLDNRICATKVLNMGLTLPLGTLLKKTDLFADDGFPKISVEHDCLAHLILLLNIILLYTGLGSCLSISCVPAMLTQLKR